MAEIVFSGSFPHDLLDLNDWRWQGPVKAGGALGKEGDGKAVNVPPDEDDTEEIEEFRDDPWFVLVADDGPEPYVRLRAPAKGATTSSSKTARSELREMHFPDDDENASWDATRSDVHNLKVRLAVTDVMAKNGKRSRVAVAQVHKTTADGIIVYVDGEGGKLKWKQDSVVQSGSLGTYTLGTFVNIGLSVRDGKCTIYVDDVPKAEGKLTGSEARTCYFKTGCYNQDNNKDDGYPADAVNEVHVAAVRVQHGTAWTSGGYAPIGPGVSAGGAQPEEDEDQHPPIGGSQTLVHGSKPHELIQFTGPKQAWKLNLDVDDHGKHSGKGKKEENGISVEKPAKTLVAEAFVHDGHFEVTEDGTAVRFLSHLNGATTKGSLNPRTELREMQAANPAKNAKWDIGDSAPRSLTAEVAVVRAPSTPGHAKVAIGQIHTDSDDLVEIQYDAEKKAVGFTWPKPDDPSKGVWQPELLIKNYRPGDWFGYRIEVAGGTVRISVDVGDGFKKVVEKTDVEASGCYFKAGAYTQSHVGQDGADPDDCGEALFRSIVATGGGV